MKHWIDRLQQERQRHACMTEIFPVLAKDLWKQLCTVMTDDLTKLHQTFSELIPEDVQVSEEQSYSLRLSPPGHFLRLTFKIATRKLLIKQIIPVSPRTDPLIIDTTLDLAFDEQQQRVQFSFREQVLFLEELSEMCLRPLITLRPFTIAEILDARVVEEINRR